MNQDQIAALKEAAEKATPGPLEYEYEVGYCGQIIGGDMNVIASFVDEPSAADARFIAQANPQAIIALLAEREALIAENTRLAECLKRANAQAERFEREWDLRGDRMEAAERDAARYRWLIANSVMGIGRWGSEWDLQIFDQPFAAPDHIGAISEWIDAAMEFDHD